MVANEIEDHVVLVVAAREILKGVIDGAIRADGLHKCHVTRAADASEMCAEPFTNLHGKRADATRCPNDEHALSGLHTATVPKPLQSRDARDRSRSRLFKAQPLRLGSQLGFLAASELSKCSLANAEHRIARLETRDSWPTATVTPATSAPRYGDFGRRSPVNRRMKDGVPRRKCQSYGLTDAAQT